MHKKQKLSLGIGALGAAAVLLSGCGGSSFQKNTFGNYANTLPAAFGLEPAAASSNLQQNPSFIETSGLGSVDSGTAYLTAASDFAVLKAPDGATLNVNVDPNSTGKVPLGFATGGAFISGTDIPAAVQTSASVVFRAALANGISSNNTPGINGASLSSTDPEWTLATLPMTLNVLKTGPLATGTYVTGTNETPAPFALPFTTSGVHTVVVTVSDDAGRQTATTFAIPVVRPSDIALFLQSFTVTTAATATTAAKTSQNPITPGDTVTIDGGAGTGTYPATGYNAATGKASAPTVADAQGTVVLFTTPGTHTVTETDAKGTVVQTSSFTLPATAAGTTIYTVPAPVLAQTSGVAGPHLIKQY